MEKQSTETKKKELKEMEKLQENPSLDEVWDLCVRYFLYDQKKYVSE